jgi:hypothetical protein
MGERIRLFERFCGWVGGDKWGWEKEDKTPPPNQNQIPERQAGLTENLVTSKEPQRKP